MGNDNGLKNFADLANMLNRMREEQPPTAAPKPKGPKQKREVSTDQRWQPLAEMNHPLPETFQVHLRMGKHPKTGRPQWFGFYEHGRDRLKVVCDPYKGHELPVGGEVWEVRVTKQIPGIVFAVAETSAALVAAQEVKRNQREADRDSWLVSTGRYVTIEVSVPQDPHLEYHNVEGVVTGYEYSGKIESVEDRGDVWIVTICDVSRSSQGWDVDGAFATDSRRHADRLTFTLLKVEVTTEMLHGRREHQFGWSQINVYRDLDPAAE